MVICGSSKKQKCTSRGTVIDGYIIYMLDDSKREGVKGITSDTVFMMDKQYIDLDVDTLIRDKVSVIPRFNKYGYIQSFDKI